MTDTLLTLATLSVVALGAWWALRLEPHWASRDGRRMIARVQSVETRQQPTGRWREVRAAVTDDGHLVTRSRGLTGGNMSGVWTLVNGRPDESGRRMLYAARRVDTTGARSRADQIVLRIPQSSRARPVLDALIARGSEPSTG